MKIGKFEFIDKAGKVIAAEEEANDAGDIDCVLKDPALGALKIGFASTALSVGRVVWKRRWHRVG
ncbi:MAG: hypothetical protein K2W95_02420 [Candidatus Obscuribacterales bacterium]|nr:hypothetical protein [Candidatus Obscuribacterales bacterium]